MGKVHGSLARAGKVKAATPKASTPSEPSKRHPTKPTDVTTICSVEPQEKKKNPKGRAYKRILYTRRFVNVTMTGGKRKVHTD
ncbi:40S ribosomal protein S30-A [Penicillium daleae]|uniref:40S ribosomal protein S30-A n=1 Tax=Penicillium daleae TaxID=63821 RepID=A0AAD6BW60_9EURO|nr:40S ribosomal protein S30-A [Penicillium daleae]KAJ5438153.1 40S ribosomal protein S30-A [Penicillium daleae]